MVGLGEPEGPGPGALSSGASLDSRVGETFVPKFLFKNQQKQDPEKRPSLGEKELLCSLKLPSLELVGGAVPKEAEGEHHGGVQLVLSGSQECLWSGSGSWFQLLVCGSSVSPGLICIPI